MEKALDLLRGSIRCAAKCRYPERFLNLCARNGIAFTDMGRAGADVVEVTVHRRDYIRLKQMAEKGSFSLRVLKKNGMPYLLWGMRKRYVLFAAMILCLLTAWVMSLFVWEIRITGNKKLTDTEILSALRGVGVKIGTFGPGIQQAYISNELMRKVPGLAFIAVNVSGSRATVIVRESTPPPQMVDMGQPAKVVALKTGVIERMTVLAGGRISSGGDTVLAGDTMVSAEVADLLGGIHLTHAMADVYARTWYERGTCIPAVSFRKVYTGQTRTKYSLILAGKRFNLYINSERGFAYCDSTTRRRALLLPGGSVLPITLVSETLSEYTPVPEEADVESTAAFLEERMTAALEKEIADCNGTVERKSFWPEVGDGRICVMMEAECREQIAKSVPLSDEEILQIRTGQNGPEGEKTG